MQGENAIGKDKRNQSNLFATHITEKGRNPSVQTGTIQLKNEQKV